MPGFAPLNPAYDAAHNTPPPLRLCVHPNDFASLGALRALARTNDNVSSRELRQGRATETPHRCLHSWRAVMLGFAPLNPAYDAACNPPRPLRLCVNPYFFASLGALRALARTQ